MPCRTVLIYTAPFDGAVRTCSCQPEGFWPQIMPVYKKDWIWIKTLFYMERAHFNLLIINLLLLQAWQKTQRWNDFWRLQPPVQNSTKRSLLSWLPMHVWSCQLDTMGLCGTIWLLCMYLNVLDTLSSCNENFKKKHEMMVKLERNWASVSHLWLSGHEVFDLCFVCNVWNVFVLRWSLRPTAC